MMDQLEIFCRTLENQWITNQYHLKKLIGFGELGCVFEATEMLGGHRKRDVVIIFIPSISGYPVKQVNEWELLINLKYPNIMVPNAFGKCKINNQNFLYLVMEKADYSLADRLRKGDMSDQETKQLVRDVASGLKALHKNNLVHQDLKIGNVFWVKDCWKISYLGIVRDLRPNNSAYTSNPVDITSYMPPEVLNPQSSIGTKLDIWFLGIMIVKVVTGELTDKFDEPDQLQQQVINGKINKTPIPSELKPIVNGCLEKDPTKRWTATEVLTALPDTSVITPKKDKHKFPWLLASVVLGIGLGGLVFRSCTTVSLPSCLLGCDRTTSTLTATPTPPTPPSVVQQSSFLDEQIYFYSAQPGTDKKGNTAYVSVYVLLRDFAWEIGSSDTIINTRTNTIGNLQNIKDNLKSARIQEDLANKLIGVISLGTSSCEIAAGMSPEEALQIEEERATERGKVIARIVADSLPPRNNINSQYILVLGQFRMCPEPLKHSLTERQRKIIIIGITDVKEINENISLEEALRDRFTRTPIAEISIDDYSTFQLKL